MASQETGQETGQELPPFFGLDFETTGLKPEEGAEIIEIAAARFEWNGSEMALTTTFSELVKPIKPITNGRYHGITDEMVEGAAPIKDVLERLIQFTGQDPVLVAHNAKFEEKFLCDALRMTGLSWTYTTRCTYEIANFLRADLFDREWRSPLRLPVLVKRFNIPIDGELHRALPDAIACGRLHIIEQKAVVAYEAKKEAALQAGIVAEAEREAARVEKRAMMTIETRASTTTTPAPTPTHHLYRSSEDRRNSRDEQEWWNDQHDRQANGMSSWFDGQ